jgi:uncharacterized protein
VLQRNAILRDLQMHYLMFYEYTADYIERRGMYRDAHLRHAWESNRRGELLLGGALADPADGAVLLFNCDSPEIPRRFAEADPYFQNGLVSAFRVRRWTTVVGAEAESPLHST